jgi:hypothetical protein
MKLYTINLVIMRKMMSMLFLLLVLIISLGLSAYMQINEGFEDNDISSEETPVEVEKEETPVEESKSEDVVPVDDSCTETMTTYR